MPGTIAENLNMHFEPATYVPPVAPVVTVEQRAIPCHDHCGQGEDILPSILAHRAEWERERNAHSR